MRCNFNFLRVWPTDLLTINNMDVVILVYLMVVVSHGNYLSGVYYNARFSTLRFGDSRYNDHCYGESSDQKISRLSSNWAEKIMFLLTTRRDEQRYKNCKWEGRILKFIWGKAIILPEAKDHGNGQRNLVVLFKQASYEYISMVRAIIHPAAKSSEWSGYICVKCFVVV